MLDDGVYGCHRWHQANLPSSMARLLRTDAEARGISAVQRGAIETVDYDGFVELTGSTFAHHQLEGLIPCHRSTFPNWIKKDFFST